MRAVEQLAPHADCKGKFSSLRPHLFLYPDGILSRVTASSPFPPKEQVNNKLVIIALPEANMDPENGTLKDRFLLQTSGMLVCSRVMHENKTNVSKTYPMVVVWQTIKTKPLLNQIVWVTSWLAFLVLSTSVNRSVFFSRKLLRSGLSARRSWLFSPTDMPNWVCRTK